MTHLEIVQLVKNREAAGLTLEEADAVRATLKESPQLYAVLGGREWVEEYLAQLPLADEVPCAAPQEDRKSAVTGQPGQRAAAVTAARRRRRQLLAGCLVLLLGSPIANQPRRVSVRFFVAPTVG